jgi:prepilin-type N-terminal cleavage/methylation domain-containing protein
MRLQRGFTLVELAVVLTIVALLIGGVLKGKEVITNARITSTIAQEKTYEAAQKNFEDVYQALPGDMPSASERVKGIALYKKAYDGGDGDGILGDENWIAAGCSPQAGVNGSVFDETTQYWGHLYQAGLISGITAPGTASNENLGVGKTHPRASLSGVFVAGYSQGGVGLPGWPLLAGGGYALPKGVVLAILRSYNSTPGYTENEQPMTAAQVAQIDRRIDDGKPTSGFVVYYGMDGAADACVYNQEYTDDNNGKNCGVFFFSH